MATEADVRKVLEGVMDPELGRNLVELGMVRQVSITDGRVKITLALTTLGCPLKDRIASDVRNAVMGLEGVKNTTVDMVEMTDEEKRRIGIGGANPGSEKGSAEHLNQIRRVIAVMSGKGGVGKSLVSGLLAVSLRRQGNQVGILDADITGPSIPKMFFANGARLGSSPLGPSPAETRMGIKVVSINLLLEQEDVPVIWRGPLVSGAIKQFWGDIFWGTLDFLVVDLPPGTSDASLTVLQSLPVSGIVLVSSPQDLAGMVVRKAAHMAAELGKPIVGLVENMSYFQCPDSGKRYDIFGTSHAEETARRIGIPLLGRLPVDPEIARLCDEGRLEDYGDGLFAEILPQIVARLK